MAENAVAAVEETGIYLGSTVHGGERGDGRGNRFVLAMDPRQTVALDVLLDLLEGDSPLGIHTLLEYRTGVAGEGRPDAYGLTMAAYRGTLPQLYEHVERVVGTPRGLPRARSAPVVELRIPLMD